MRQPVSILVVDDDPEMRALVQDVLSAEGYEIVEAKDGADAVLALRARAFDVILMDKNMPGPSGLDLLPGLRRVAPGTQIIMMTPSGTCPRTWRRSRRAPSSSCSSPFQWAR